MNNHYNCIYMYTNKINGKRYVGQTVDFNKRHKEHISCSYSKKNKYQYNYPFHRAIRKYSIENFEIKILAENIPTQEKMNEYEKFFIKRYNALCKNRKGYNISDGGSNGNNFAGKTEEEIIEIRKKQSEAQKGENNPMYGKHHSEETKQKISENRKGKQLSEEHKQKLSDAKKGKYNGENHQMYGKHHSEETKKKISENHADFSGEKHPLAKRVAQYDKQGNLIKIWDYAKQISKENPEINYSGLCSVLQGRTKTHQYKGYIWRYAEETE